MNTKLLRKFVVAVSLILAWSSIQYAFAAAPTVGTAVAWTDDTYFDSYSTQSGLTSSDKGAVNFLVWQVYYTYAPLSLPLDTVNRVGVATYGNGVNASKARIAISSVDDTLGSFGADFEFAATSSSVGYSAGGFMEYKVTTAVTIPAHRYFMIGTTGGPAYRTFKTLGNNRTAQIAGVNYITSMNTVYWSTTASAGIPVALGGLTDSFTTYAGYVPLISIKFKITGPPPLPPLSRPETPTVTSLDGSYVTITNPSLVANAQSYYASLYAANGTTFIESRTVTNSQVTNGFTWTGLSAQTSYHIGFTAVGDAISYADSLMSPLRPFTTTLNSTSVNLTFSSSMATFNSPITITATLGGATSGKITFYSNGKRIPNCVSKVVSSSTSTCIWKSATRGASIVTAVFTPSGASYASSSTMRSILITNRTLNR